MAYSFFIGDVMLPVTPPALELKIKNHNKTITLINDGEINILKNAERLLRRLAGRRNRAVSFLVLLAVPVFVLFVGFRILNSREETARVNAENEKLQQQIDRLQAQNDGYRAVLENDDPEVFRDYVVRTARERLGLSLPGDQVFIDRALFKSNP